MSLSSNEEHNQEVKIFREERTINFKSNPIKIGGALTKRELELLFSCVFLFSSYFGSLILLLKLILL